MLSIAKMSSSGQGEYYLSLATEDYYLSGGEPPGQWFGAGAGSQGLRGEVQREDLRNLFLGRSPDGTRPLVQNAGDHKRQIGHDLTWSAPKSVSVLWAVSSPEVRQKIQAAHDNAVRGALQWLEENALFTRRGHQGSVREKVGMIAALFEHGTSRAQEPQLHTHALLVNLCSREDGTSGTIVSRPLYQHKMESGYRYREILAANLERTLGVFTIWGRKGFFEIAGIPKSVCRGFSSRGVAIKAQLQKWGTHTAVAAKAANLKTREAKLLIPRAELFARWASRGCQLQFGPKDAAALLQSSIERRIHVVAGTATAPETSDRAQAIPAQSKLTLVTAPIGILEGRLTDTPKLPSPAKAKPSPSRPTSVPKSRQSAVELTPVAAKKKPLPQIPSAAEVQQEPNQTIAASSPNLSHRQEDPERRRTAFERAEDSELSEGNSRHTQTRTYALMPVDPKVDRLPRPSFAIETRQETDRAIAGSGPNLSDRADEPERRRTAFERAREPELSERNHGHPPTRTDELMPADKKVDRLRLIPFAAETREATNQSDAASSPYLSRRAEEPEQRRTVPEPVPNHDPAGTNSRRHQTGTIELVPADHRKDTPPLASFANEGRQEPDRISTESALNPRQVPIKNSSLTTVVESVRNSDSTTGIPPRQRRDEFRGWAEEQRNYGRVLFRIPLTRLEVRSVRERVFWKAPQWSPVRKILLPRFAVARAGKPIWEVSRPRSDAPLRRYGPFLVRNQRLFPEAPSWSPAAKFTAPVLSFRPSLAALSAARFRFLSPSKSERPKPLVNDLSR